MILLVLALVAVALTARLAVAEKMYSISASYLGDRCGGTPYAVTIVQDDNCTTQSCSSTGISTADMITVDCETDYVQATRDKFGSSPYVIELQFGTANCTDSALGYGYPASGTCVGGYNETDSYYVIASLDKNGSASIGLYPDRSCLSESVYSLESGVASRSCDVNWTKWYSSNDVLNGSGSSSSTSEEDPSSPFSSGDILGISIEEFSGYQQVTHKFAFS
ncbi:uncharacterized protein KRP23_8164 [Phytophthora ramorum]|uniref:uncharacterized protein n=1 Tax=Phytophthora ramorum TaxID=164328 RepID=UPI0030A56DE1|nr:hypothetical protein KRP23_8164 [Phytophthora ramorum]